MTASLCCKCSSTTGAPAPDQHRSPPCCRRCFGRPLLLLLPPPPPPQQPQARGYAGRSADAQGLQGGAPGKLLLLRASRSAQSHEERCRT
eukprot:scaffold3613_cov331-Prasinococcus_capsulatus_cf.AAC.3